MDKNLKVLNAMSEGFVTRIGAVMIDSLVLSPFIFTYLYLVRVYSSSMDVKWLATIIMLLIVTVYNVSLPSIKGGTLGKRSAHMKILNADCSHMSLGKSMLRYLPFLITHTILALSLIINSTILTILVIGVLVYYFIEFNYVRHHKRCKTLRDIMVETYVIRDDFFKSRSEGYMDGPAS